MLLILCYRCSFLLDQGVRDPGVYVLLQQGQLEVLGIRTGEFLTPAEGAAVAKALQPTGLFDCLRTCDIYVGDFSRSSVS